MITEESASLIESASSASATDDPQSSNLNNNINNNNNNNTNNNTNNNNNNNNNIVVGGSVIATTTTGGVGGVVVGGESYEEQFRPLEEELHNLRAAEVRLKQQYAESQRRERHFVRRLAAKEQEIQDYINQIAELKAAQAPGPQSLRNALLDPAINILFQKLKNELQATRARLEETQNELSAWKFTPDSNTGKRLMAKCRLLYQENEELGKMTSNGRLAKLEGDLALQKSFGGEIKKSQSEMDDFLQELDEDVEGMQSTILYLQQELKISKETIGMLQRDIIQLKNGNIKNDSVIIVGSDGNDDSSCCNNNNNNNNNNSEDDTMNNDDETNCNNNNRTRNKINNNNCFKIEENDIEMIANGDDDSIGDHQRISPLLTLAPQQQISDASSTVDTLISPSLLKQSPIEAVPAAAAVPSTSESSLPLALITIGAGGSGGGVGHINDNDKDNKISVVDRLFKKDYINSNNIITNSNEPRTLRSSKRLLSITSDDSSIRTQTKLNKHLNNNGSELVVCLNNIDDLQLNGIGNNNNNNNNTTNNNNNRTNNDNNIISKNNNKIINNNNNLNKNIIINSNNNNNKRTFDDSSDGDSSDCNNNSSPTGTGTTTNNNQNVGTKKLLRKKIKIRRRSSVLSLDLNEEDCQIGGGNDDENRTILTTIPAISSSSSSSASPSPSQSSSSSSTPITTNGGSNINNSGIEVGKISNAGATIGGPGGLTNDPCVGGDNL